MEVDNFDQLVALLSSHPLEAGCLVVSVDGGSGAGKTTLGDRLGEALGAKVIHIDDYVDKGKGAYRQAVRYAALGRDIERLSGDVQVLIVEGNCLLQILEKVCISPKTRVYVKRLRLDGSWGEKSTCDHTLGRELMMLSQVNDTVRDQPEGGALAGGESFGAILDRELIDYHCVYEPSDTATYVYEWREQRPRANGLDGSGTR